MLSWLLCALFAVCEPAEAPAPVATSEAATMAVAVPLVAKWEGLETTAYLDRIASPPVWTICYGETQGVRPGETRTREQCEDGLMRGLVQYRNGLHRHFQPETIQRRLTPERDAAFVSLSWNVGIAGAGGSTATRRLNAGDIRGSCEALTWWNRAGQRVVRGLVNRRAEEQALCLRGL
jgi:GH24 family phage-related lysozyme (muramidase)